MATTRIMPLHVGKGRTESRAISDIIDYVANPKKTDNWEHPTAQNWQTELPTFAPRRRVQRKVVLGL